MPCPNCGTTVEQSRADGRCSGCGQPLPEGLRAPPESAAKLAESVGFPGAVPAFSAHHDRALAHLKKREYEQAVAEYTQAIRLDPKAPNAYLGRALAYRSLGDEENAVRDEGIAKELGGAEKSTWGRLVNRAYQLWKGDSHASRSEFYQSLHPLQRQAVLLWELNSQVFNGGFPQWLQNGYGVRIKEIIDSVKQIGGDAAKEVQTILEGVSVVAKKASWTDNEADQDLAELLKHTDRYYAVAPAFGGAVETWLEEQLRKG